VPDADRWRRIAIAAGRLSTIAIVASVALPLVPVWPCALLEHFRVHYVVVGVAVVAAVAALRMRGWFDAALISTLATLCLVVPGLGGAPRPLPDGGVPVRVLVLNVHTSNRAFDRVGALIEELAPDVVGLVEVDQRWIDALAPALTGYAGRIEEPRADNFGVALYARRPLAGGVELLGGTLPTAVATLDLGGATLAFLLTHPLPPVRSAQLDAQLAQLDAVAARALAIAGPVVVAGDLNATPWSRPFVRLLDGARLCDTRAGRGVQATFPAALALVRIPIDHVLASCEIGVRARWIERDVGSDHLPVVVELVVPRSDR